MTTLTDVVCLYQGRPDECPECGGFNETGTRFCSHDCAASWDERVATLEAARVERRRREDAFAAAAQELRDLGHTDEEIDQMLAGMPS